MRASTIFASEPVVRKHEAAKFGQTCLKQFRAAERTGSRSAFANATASLALALGANAGKAITDVPSPANIARARRDLIIWDANWVQADPAALGDHTTNSHREQSFRGHNLYLRATDNTHLSGIRPHRHENSPCDPSPVAGQGAHPRHMVAAF